MGLWFLLRRLGMSLPLYVYVTCVWNECIVAMVRHILELNAQMKMRVFDVMTWWMFCLNSKNRQCIEIELALIKASGIAFSLVTYIFWPSYYNIMFTIFIFLGSIQQITDIYSIDHSRFIFFILRLALAFSRYAKILFHYTRQSDTTPQQPPLAQPTLTDIG